MIPAIKIENLGKKYRRGEVQAYSTSFRDSLTHITKETLTRLPSRLLQSVTESKKREAHASDESLEFWAIRDINFEVREGEIVGVIGRNGAGKSTLLKILSRITAPTCGTVRYQGRMASLLEVGSGFHRELTGRENIYLNGAILGMRRAEIRRKLDQIVAFAEVEKFLDTPVKFYSSGMYVRLAFAVAAHLETEILIIDEVLAVGDASFQKKCLGKMGEVAEQGRTVLFVSHTMPMILNLCSRCVLLEGGRVTADNEPTNVVNLYLSKAMSTEGVKDLNPAETEGTGLIQIKRFTVTNEQGEPSLLPDKPAIFRMTLETKRAGLKSSKANIAIGVSNNEGERVFELLTKFDKTYQSSDFTFEGSTTVTCATKQFPLRPGIYYLTLYVDYGGELCCRMRDAISVVVQDSDFFGTGASLLSSHGWYLLEQSWSLKKD